MQTDALETFIARSRAAWGPLTSELVSECRQGLEVLLKASPEEPWLAALHRDAPASRELYRDPEAGFVLQAHAEHAGLYRPPHDHGRSWVIYAVEQGEVEMGTYARVEGPDGAVRLVRRGSTLVRAGEVQVYLPGDIHDTRCLSASALLFRFTERDLKQEKGMVRYAEESGVWAPRAAA